MRTKTGRRRRFAASSPAALDDEELCALGAAGNADAVAELTARHRAWLVELCRRQLNGDAHRAEDIAQECLIKFHAALLRDHRPLRPRAWLSVVARNACIDVHRARRADLPGALPDTPVVDADPFEADPVLASAWEALSDRHRDVLHHRELIGLSYEEIATLMETSVSAIETLLFRARAALRRNYQREGGTLLGCGLFGMSLARMLDGDRPAGLDAHLAACSDCSRAAEHLATTTQLLRTGATAVAHSGMSGPHSTAIQAIAGAAQRVAGVLHRVAPFGAAPAAMADAVPAVAAPWVAAAVALSAGLATAAFAGVGAPEPPRPAVTASTIEVRAPSLVGPDAVGSLPSLTRLVPPPPTADRTPTSPQSRPSWAESGSAASDPRSHPTGFDQCWSADDKEASSPSTTWQRPSGEDRTPCGDEPHCMNPPESASAPPSSTPPCR